MNFLCSPLGHYFVSCGNDRTARLWSTDHFQPLRIFAGHLADVDVSDFFPMLPASSVGCSMLFGCCRLFSFIQTATMWRRVPQTAQSACGICPMAAVCGWWQVTRHPSVAWLSPPVVDTWLQLERTRWCWCGTWVQAIWWHSYGATRTRFILSALAVKAPSLLQVSSDPI